MNIDRDKTMSHRRAWELLPWYVNGSLDGGELEALEAHLGDCEACRHELALEERWAREIRASEELVYSPERAFAELSSRLAESDSGRRRSPQAARESWWRRWLRPLLEGGAGGLRVAVAVQAAVMLLLVGVLWVEPEPAEFRTVSDVVAEAEVEGAHVRVVFEEEITEAELRRILLSAEARFVDGPSRRGLYTLEIAEDRFDETVERLRNDDRVLFAEPR